MESSEELKSTWPGQVQGSFQPVDIPYPNIYISASAKQKEAKQKYNFQTDVSSFHFHVILLPGNLYTEEDIKFCQGRYHCHNCQRPIINQIYFYPEKSILTNEFEVNAIPHCRPACVYRTVQDIPNNNDLLTLLFLMYGPDITCAPPRFLLSIPGGLSLEEYHKVVDDELLVTSSSDEDVQYYFAPVYVSCTLFKNHQLVPDIVAFIDEMNWERKASLGPSRDRDNSQLNVIELPKTSLSDTKLSQMFTIDTNSYTRLPNDPHMMDTSD